MKKLSIVCTFALIILGCSKKNNDNVIPIPLTTLGIESSLNSTELTSNEIKEFQELIYNFGLKDSIDISQIYKYPIILNGNPTGSFFILSKFYNSNEIARKNISITQKEGVLLSNTSTIISINLTNSNKAVLKYSDLTTGWSSEYVQIQGQNIQTKINPGFGEKPTWWECMTNEVNYFTSTLAGAIAIGLYPEPILGMMAAKCAYLAYSGSN